MNADDAAAPPAPPAGCVLPAGFDAAKHWLAVSSILLIIGAASVAVPLALRVAASEYRFESNKELSPTGPDRTGPN